MAPSEIGLTPDIEVEATSADGAVVSFALPPVSDDVDPTPVVTAVPASGSQFPLGATTVTITATDAAGHSASATFTVTVVDTTPPTITPPADQVLEATSPAGAVATFAATATDIASSPTITYSHAPGSTFPLGITVVTATAIDGSGNRASASFTVTVRDTRPPVIAGVSINRSILWPPQPPDGGGCAFVSSQRCRGRGTPVFTGCDQQ
jgi:hypothetical protein